MQMIGTLILVITVHGQWAVNGLNGGSSPWQRLSRRTNVRAALANKLDPNFWPTRGRRSELPHLQRQASDEDGPFWANRGRSVSQLLDENNIYWPASEDGAPFWANRGRATDEASPPFWANRGRSLHDAVMTSSEQGPFWANRGRAIDERSPSRLQRDILYAEEPVWLSLPQHGGRRSAIAAASPHDDKPDESDTFWITRGKKQDPNSYQQACRHQPDKNGIQKPCRERSAK